MRQQLTDLDRQRRRIALLGQQIETALMRRPGAVPPWSPWSAMQALDRLGHGPVMLADADQLDRIECFARLWLELIEQFGDIAVWSSAADDDGIAPPASERWAC
ncbi:hypothetical protein [Mycobacterium sp. SMC-4]|uniref:hypothetical protein n=1 Tax=Mycobacterium sp. SMC-4 TaxID=2857059 RepID=UPI0021B4176D|nr:hypothetical protein [Mycobacterium sp. SMC-4]UXA16975.1 hypothetical protein KXD98_19760 [Mycobacterium sp. SMC-4]